MATVDEKVSLTESERQFVEDQVASGRHASTSDVVHEALRYYADRVAADGARLRALAEAGEADIRAGRFIEAATPRDLRRIVEEVSRDADEIAAEPAQRRG